MTSAVSTMTDIDNASGTEGTRTNTMAFMPPVITAHLMPRPDPVVEKQSAEDWFKIFRTVADSFISIYRTAGQENVGQ